ncbi:MAG: hypothetical protein JWN95_4006 [Frankiales bacterium]|nr:hypothetical protein [Frankiales bacterium]
MRTLSNQPDDLAALVVTTADALGIDAGFVEKDFWVASAQSVEDLTALLTSAGER